MGFQFRVLGFMGFMEFMEFRVLYLGLTGFLGFWLPVFFFLEGAVKSIPG